jgi:hypothetical protein
MQIRNTRNIIRNTVCYSALALSCMLLTTVAANADCGGATAGRLTRFTRLPMAAQPAASHPQRPGVNPIVGLWHVNYVSGGAPFLESFDTWHADGTEFETANFNPVEGSVCVGVWKKVGPRTVQLNHIGWNFDAAGNSIGTFTLNETNTVSWDGNTYTGTFDYKVYDTDGTPVYEATGTQTATRITVD